MLLSLPIVLDLKLNYMRKIQLFIVFALCIFLFSCNDTKVDAASDSSISKKNVSASNAISSAFETGDVSKIDSVVADDFVDHTERGDVKGKDSLKAMITMVHNTNKDMKMEVVKELADDDYVFSWMHFTGTSDGTMAPAGPYDMQAIEAGRYKDGKVVEHWEFVNSKEMMDMMQKMQGMKGMDKMDHSMMDSSKVKHR